MNRKKVIIIAEAGVNHNGSLVIARKLIDVASKAGADFVKFQTFNVENLVLPGTTLASYQKINSRFKNQYELLKKLQLSEKKHLELIKYCKKKKIKFLSTAFDIKSIKFLNTLKLTFFKIPSGEITNYPYLAQIAKFKKDVIVSTGMSTIADIYFCIKVLTTNGLKKDQIYLMHCNTSYPTPDKDANLKCILTMKKKFNTKIGYSDHTSGIIAPILAVALGAKIIEKHFTINKKLQGPDHQASLEPNEFYDMVKKIRQTEILLGSQNKKITNSEKKNIKVVRKSIVASTFIKKGEILNEKNLDTKRPLKGICASKWEFILGRKAKKNYKKNDFIN